MTGLIKSGAIKSEQIPLWYPVYQAFPPKYEPRFDRVADDKPVRKILYQEDIVRAKYYKTFGEREVVNLFKEVKSTSQIFVDKYMELSQSGGHGDQELWDRTVSTLEMEGVSLGGENVDGSQMEDSKYEFDKPKLNISFQELFSKTESK